MDDVSPPKTRPITGAHKVEVNFEERVGQICEKINEIKNDYRQFDTIWDKPPKEGQSAFLTLAGELIDKIDALREEITRDDNFISRFVYFILSPLGVGYPFEHELDELRKIEENINRLNEILEQKQWMLDLTSLQDLGEREFTELFRVIHDLNADIEGRSSFDPDAMTSFIDEMTLHLFSLEKTYQTDKRKQAAVLTLFKHLDQLRVSVGLKSANIRTGGICNAGTTCFLASALQTVIAIPHFRRCFDPNQNPLRQRKGELDQSFSERKEIQRAAFSMIERVEDSESISSDEIQKFRLMCYNHKISHPARQDRRGVVVCSGEHCV